MRARTPLLPAALAALAIAGSAPAAPPTVVDLAGATPEGGRARLHVEVGEDSVRAVWRPDPREAAHALAGPAPDGAAALLRVPLALAGEDGKRRLDGTLDLAARTFAGTWTEGRKPTAVSLAVEAETVRRTWRCGPRLDLELTYPRLLGDDPAVAAVNALLEVELGERQAAFAREGLEAIDDSPLPGEAWQQSLAGSLAVRTDGFVSVVVRDSHYTGGAHPNTAWSTVNVRLAGDEAIPVELVDLFRDGDEELEGLSERVRDDLRDQGASAVVDGTVVHFGPDALAAWTLSPDGLTFLFDPYTVGSYAEGTYRVTIPLDRLAKAAAADGPLARLREEGR